MEGLWILSGGKRRRACFKKCRFCGKDFLDRVGKGKIYCSLGCKNNDQEKDKIKFDCATCGKKFARLPSKCKAKSEIYFCSKSCKDRAAKLNGGIKEIYPDHYGTGEIHRDLFNLDELKCSRCGYDEFAVGIDIHHLDGNHDNNEKSNLLPLCSPCHRALHKCLWKLADLAEMV